jgi:hypothetical protein
VWSREHLFEPTDIVREKHVSGLNDPLLKLGPTRVSFEFFVHRSRTRGGTVEASASCLSFATGALLPLSAAEWPFTRERSVASSVRCFQSRSACGARDLVEAFTTRGERDAHDSNLGRSLGKGTRCVVCTMRDRKLVEPLTRRGWILEQLMHVAPEFLLQATRSRLQDDGSDTVLRGNRSGGESRGLLGGIARLPVILTRPES